MKTMINIKTDKDVKEEAQKTAKELGVPLSTVINAFLKEFVRNKSVSFSAVPRMTPYLERVLDEVEKDLKEGKNMVGPFDNAEDLMKSLDEK